MTGKNEEDRAPFGRKKKLGKKLQEIYLRVTRMKGEL
jgi:hypothetical protein